MTATSAEPFVCLGEAEFGREIVSAMPKVRAFARGICRDATAADDLVQDTMAQALRNRERFRAGTNIGAWLCFIGRNIFYSGKRRSWRSVPMEDGQAERVPMAESQLTRILAAEAYDALQYLTPDMREAILLIGQDGLSYEEAADLLGVAIGTVKSRVSRARETLDLFFSTNNQTGGFHG